MDMLTSDASDIFKNLPVIETPRMLLRPLTMQDADDIFAYSKNPAISRYVLWDSPKTIEETRCFLRSVLANYAAGIPEDWAIVLKETGRCIGTCGFFDWYIKHAKAEIHYALSLEYSGRGLMTEAVGAMLGFGFGVMKLNRVAAACFPENLASEQVMKKSGMQFEGIMRAGVYAKGRFHDVKIYAVLRSDRGGRP